MAKGTLKDRTVEDARNKALRMSHVPDSIRATYSVSFEAGSVILTKKNAKVYNKDSKKKPKS